MLPYFLIALLWYPVAVVLPLIQMLHALQQKSADVLELRKIWLFYWLCYMGCSVALSYFEWLITIPFYILSYYVDIYHEVQLICVLLLVLPKPFMLKKVYLYCESNGPMLLEKLTTVLWNATLVICMLPSAYLVALVGNFWLSKTAKDSREVARKQVNEVCIAVTCLCWRLVTTICFWVRIDVDGLEAYRAECGASGRPVVIIGNHCSFMDIILAVALTPLSQVVKVKMLISAHVFKMPVVGTIAGAMGHLSIPFKAASEDSKDMSVDKEAVEQRMKVLTEHLASGGNAAWFPEGTINRGDTQQVQTFRAGGFAPVIQLDAEVWCLAQVGNSVFWPARAPVGGRPCRIGYKIMRICESTHAFCAHEADERAKALHLANSAHEKAQEALDKLVAKGFSGTLKPEQTKAKN
mmetsp:Transcript_80607/g.152213  ORF Transcript_80607/g.152213 Transcript_80607/m.152213 type:complete len:409 (-) Transcript_80607:60-1286(-)